MKLLFKAAFFNKKHFLLMCFTLASLFFLTLTSSLEMFALGVISDKNNQIFSKYESESSTDGSSFNKKVNPIQKLFLKLDSTFKLNHNEMTGKKLASVLSMVACVVFLKALGLFFSRFSTQMLSVNVSKDLRQRYFEHLQKLPMSFYQKYNIGMIASRVGVDASQIAFSINAFVTNYFHTPVKIVFTLVVCFLISWQLTSVIFIGIPLIVLPVIFLTKRVKKITRELQKNQEKFTTVLIDFLAGIQTVKIFSMEKFTLCKYKEQNDEMAHLEIKTAKYDLLIRPILHMITIFCVIGIMFFGLYTLKMSLSELLMFCGFLHQFYEPVKKFSEENAIIQKGVVAAERMFEVLELNAQDEDGKENEQIHFNSEIEFRNVWFRYEEKWILKDLCFSLKKGQTLAIVGATGAGKSTIVNLLPRLYEIQKGSILIDGIPIQDLSKKSLRKVFSFVPQKPFLFFDTVKANINYGEDFSDEKIKEAAIKAQAHEFIANLPKEYDTMLSEAGKNLSGGQQQRIAVARALVKQAPILILDEATSSLDSLSEHAIKNAIRNLHGDVTQIIIAHRLSTIEHADKILFLENGEVVSEGTKDELLKKCPMFKQMWELHFLSSEKELIEEESMI